MTDADVPSSLKASRIADTNLCELEALTERYFSPKIALGVVSVGL